jgi:uncharacterized membrane-anchored protein YitT (DUF2179 family)
MAAIKRPQLLVILGIVFILIGVAYFLSGNRGGAAVGIVGIPLIAAGRRATRLAAAKDGSRTQPPASPQ